MHKTWTLSSNKHAVDYFLGWDFLIQSMKNSNWQLFCLIFEKVFWKKKPNNPDYFVISEKEVGKNVQNLILRLSGKGTIAHFEDLLICFHFGQVNPCRPVPLSLQIKFLFAIASQHLTSWKVLNFMSKFLENLGFFGRNPALLSFLVGSRFKIWGYQIWKTHVQKFTDFPLGII